MRPQQLIARKRDGDPLTTADIDAWIAAVTRGEHTPAQVAAMLMAILCRGMDARETADLTRAMCQSGAVLNWTAADGPIVDKHSTGGVGDKVSLVLAPLAAAAGLRVPMISGRGLGHTGGTLDKLEAIPGLRVDLPLDQVQAQVRAIGCAMVGQTAELAPADRILYALRDHTATVESVPLICASILSKKSAEGISALALDVKCGAGAFMQGIDAARELARALIACGQAMGLPVTALISDMDTPLGRAVGNAVEVAEAIAVLRGEGPADTRELTLELTAELLCMTGQGTRHADARTRLAGLLANGAALERFARMIEAQGGDPRVTDNPALLPAAPHTLSVAHTGPAGWVRSVAARAVAEIVLALGAGRRLPGDKVHPAVGISDLVQPGERIESGAPLARMHAIDSAAAARAADLLRAAISFADNPTPRPRLVRERILP